MIGGDVLAKMLHRYHSFLSSIDRARLGSLGLGGTVA